MRWYEFVAYNTVGTVVHTGWVRCETPIIAQTVFMDSLTDEVRGIASKVESRRVLEDERFLAEVLRSKQFVVTYSPSEGVFNGTIFHFA